MNNARLQLSAGKILNCDGNDTLMEFEGLYLETVSCQSRSYVKEADVFPNVDCRQMGADLLAAVENEDRTGTMDGAMDRMETPENVEHLIP